MTDDDLLNFLVKGQDEDFFPEEFIAGDMQPHWWRMIRLLARRVYELESVLRD